MVCFSIIIIIIIIVTDIYSIDLSVAIVYSASSLERPFLWFMVNDSEEVRHGLLKLAMMKTRVIIM